MTGDAESPSDLIDTKIAELGKWRGETLAWMRKLIRKADPDVVETVKWRKPTNPGGVPVWEYADILCSVETYKVYAKLTCAKGALLPDPSGLFNGNLKLNLCRWKSRKINWYCVPGIPGIRRYCVPGIRPRNSCTRFRQPEWSLDKR